MMKKTFAVILALLLCIALAAPAFASDDFQEIEMNGFVNNDPYFGMFGVTFEAARTEMDSITIYREETGEVTEENCAIAVVKPGTAVTVDGAYAAGMEAPEPPFRANVRAYTLRLDGVYEPYPEYVTILSGSVDDWPLGKALQGSDEPIELLEFSGFGVWYVRLDYTAVVTPPTPAATNTETGFTDVAEDAYYAEAVAWAVENGITNGMGDGTFAPGNTVNRAQAVTFLWRMAGKPAPTKTETFPDVESDPNNSWYKTAVQWAVEKGITNGTGSGFSPTDTCSRGMILTMLYRMEGRPWDEAMAAVVPEDPESMTDEEFGFEMIQGFVEGIRAGEMAPDVGKGAWYEYPVFWAMYTNILNENQIDPVTGAVNPVAPCPRGEMVSYLFVDSQYKQWTS